jgi:hypothetical protein
MNSGTVISIILSSLALLVSGATFYLTVLRKKAAFVGCLLATSTVEFGDDDDWVFEFALANTGDVELLVTEANLDLPTDGVVPILSSDALPLVLEPGQVRSLALDLPNKFCWQLSRRREPLIFSFRVFSARGTVYVPQITVAVTADDPAAPITNWTPFTLGQAIR